MVLPRSSQALCGCREENKLRVGEEAREHRKGFTAVIRMRVNVPQWRPWRWEK